MQLFILIFLVLILTGCQSAVRSPFEMQQKFYGSVRSSGLAADQAIRSAHYFKIAGRKDLAMRELSSALSLDPHNLRLLNSLGACYDEMGDYATAQQIFNQTLALDPDNAAALNNLGYSYYLAGKFDQAEAMLQTSLTKDPTNKRTRNNLGLVLCRLGKNKQAMSLWQQQDGEAGAREKVNQVMASLGQPIPGNNIKPEEKSQIMIGSSRAGSSPAHPAAAPLETAAVEPANPGRLKASSGEISVQGIHNSSPMETRSPYLARSNVPAAGVVTRTAAAEATEPAAIAPTAFQSENPSSHSRTKMISVVDPQDQRSAGQEAEQNGNDFENCLLLGPSQEPSPSRHPKRKVQMTASDTQATEPSTIEIRNGVGIRNLANKYRRLFQQNGYNVSIAANHVNFAAPETVIYFRPDQEKAAQALNQQFLAGRLEKREYLRPGIDIKVVLGHDLYLKGQNQASWQSPIASQEH